MSFYVLNSFHAGNAGGGVEGGGDEWVRAQQPTGGGRTTLVVQ